MILLYAILHLMLERYTQKQNKTQQPHKRKIKSIKLYILHIIYLIYICVYICDRVLQINLGKCNMWPIWYGTTWYNKLKKMTAVHQDVCNVVPIMIIAGNSCYTKWFLSKKKEKMKTTFRMFIRGNRIKSVPKRCQKEETPAHTLHETGRSKVSQLKR